MPHFNTYNAIVSAVQEMAEDDSQEFLDFIPKSIELAQLRLMDELDLEAINTRIAVTCTPFNNLVLKPQGYRFTNNVFVDVSGRSVPLKSGSTDYLTDYWPTPTSVGVPEYYSSDYSSAQFMLAPTPSSAYVLTLDLRVDTPLISAGNQANYFTENCGNALYFATMKEQASFMKNSSVREEFEAKFLNAIQGINNRGRRNRRQDGGTASTTESGKNTLLGTK